MQHVTMESCGMSGAIDGKSYDHAKRRKLGKKKERKKEKEKGRHQCAGQRESPKTDKSRMSAYRCGGFFFLTCRDRPFGS